MLLRHLPPTSAFTRAAAPDTAALAKWSTTDYLLADLFDLTVKTKRWRTPPKPYPRPADEIRQRERQKERAAALDRQNERIQQRQREAG